MNDNEKLIEEARKWGPESMSSRLIRRLADALKAAEKAHTPTDDERDALAQVVSDAMDAELPEDLRSGSPTPVDENVADAILAAGFRRSEVPEPSAEADHDIEPWSSTGRIDSPVSCKTCDRALFIGADGEWEHVARPEPQGEPSDAAVIEAVHQIGLRGFHVTAAAMRAALRAAGGVR